MTVPESRRVQLAPSGYALFTVDSVTDPDGTPVYVLDGDLGFVVRGTVTMPVSFTGTGTVCLYVDQLGGPFNGRIACTDVKFEQKQGQPSSSQTMAWTVTYPSNGDRAFDPSFGSALYRLTAVLEFGEQSLDIVIPVEMGMYAIR